MLSTANVDAIEDWKIRGNDRGQFFAHNACCESCAFGAEMNDRQSADFCNGDCVDLNGLPSHDDSDFDDDNCVITSEEAWEAYEDGISDAVQHASLIEYCKAVLKEEK